MLVIKIELHSAIDGHIEEVGRMILYNDRGGDRECGNYRGVIEPRTERVSGWSLPEQVTGRVTDYPRLDRPVWNLVTEMLANMRFGVARDEPDFGSE